MKFLCDQMCLVLGRWLRIAGYDTSMMDAPLDDEQIFKIAVQEDRYVITRDRDFLKMDPDENKVIHLKGETLDEWAKELKTKGVDWLYNPFSRCLKCNTPLEKLHSQTYLQIPENVKEAFTCPTCKRIYWLGTHTEKMEQQLKIFKLI